MIPRCITFSIDFPIDFSSISLHFFSINPSKSFQKSSPRCITFSIDCSIEFSSILAYFWKPTWAVLDRLGSVLGHLGPSWRPLGALLGRLGGLLGPLGGQDPPEARGRCFREASWDRLGLIFGRLLDHLFNEFSLLFLSYLTRRQHVVRPQN